MPGTPLYESVYNHLKKQILEQHYRPGDLLPTEQELMEQFGVSRMTTGRALQLLTLEGVIVRKPGVGTFVSEQSPVSGEAAHGVDLVPVAGGRLRNLRVGAPEVHGHVGFVIPFLGQSFGPVLLQEVERGFSANKFTLSIACSYGSQDIEAEAVTRLVAAGAQGLIVFPVNGEFYNPAILRLHLEGLPIVLVDKQLAGIPVPCVTTDNVQAARRLTEHLIQLGHRSIAYFSQSWDDTSTLVERRTGFRETIEQYRMERRPEWDLLTIPWQSETVDGLDAEQVRVIADFLVQHPDVTAVFATDDQLAEYWVSAAIRTGRKVPQDLSIVCFDGPPSRAGHWAFTRALQDQVTMAQEAVHMLLELFETASVGDQSTVVRVPAHIHIGESSGPIHSQAHDTDMVICTIVE
ncbi:MAG: GntR family transcriptional regulator [Firmicutes bacterium]|nr:GntR family transcriptional regulator [Bacillota bacterium]